MASEQLAGAMATASGDQFAYCASLYEALFGQRAFAGDHVSELIHAIARGPRMPELRTRLERRVWRVLKRGLAAAPESRFGSMDALLGALRRARRDPAWRGAAAAGVLVAIGAGAYALHGGGALACDDSRARLVGVWDPDRRTTVAAAFHASGRAHSDASLALVDRALDDYAAAWTTMRDDACRATYERHEQSPQLLDLRAACLEQRREELRAFTEALGHADAALVDRAATSVRTLSNVARCGDATALLSVLPPPGDALLRARIDRTRAGLARVNALRIAGKFADAHREVAPLVAEARAIGYAPLQAEALLGDEQIDVRPPDLKAASAQLRDAIVLAEQGHDQETQLLAWAALPFVQAAAGDRDAAIESLRHGEALLEGLGRPLRLEAEVLPRLGAAASKAERLADAERWQLRALYALEKLYPPGDPALGQSHVSLGNIYLALNRLDDAMRHQRAALEIYERAFGGKHVRTCVARSNLAGELEQADRLDEALAAAHRAVAECERAMGPSSAPLSYALMNESSALQRLGRLDEALPLLLRAQEMSDKLSGPNSPDASALLANLASLRSHRGELDAALELIDRALVIAVKSFGPDSAQVRHETETRTEILLLARRPRDALAPAERYRELAQQIPDGDVRGRMVLGRALVAAGKLAEAHALLAPIFDAAHPLAGKPIDVAAARFVLARALGGADPAQRQAIEQAARDALAKLGPAGHEMLRDLDLQLPSNAPPPP
jgi:hypothetical protein